MAWALVFLASAVATFAFAFFTPLARPRRVAIAVIAIVLLLVLYVTATESPLSPFGRGGISFGAADEAIAIAIGVGGALAGVVGSVVFRLDENRFKPSAVIKPVQLRRSS